MTFSLSRSLLNCEISSLEYDTDGLTIAVGTSTGHVLLYDLRSPIPLQIKDHKYQQPIRDIKFHPTSRKIISSDTKIIKLWDRDSVRAYLIGFDFVCQFVMIYAIGLVSATG
jgi:ribosome biogenesis protein ENP2